MSKGSPIIPLRLNEIHLREIDAAIKATNKRRSLAPYTRSSWIRAAIEDRLQHIQRSRKAKAKARQHRGARV